MTSLLARVHMVMLLASYWQDSVACLGGGASVLCEAFAGVDGSAVVLHIHMYQGSSSGHDTARDSRGHQAHTQASETAVHWRGGLTDPSAWPEDYVNGRWKRQIPISFLLENSGPRVAACIGVINAICSGGFCSLASAKRSGLSCSSSDPCMPVEVRSVRAFWHVWQHCMIWRLRADIQSWPWECTA